MKMTKSEYVTHIAIATQNAKIFNIAEALFHGNIDSANAIEFLGHWDNLDDRSGTWSDDRTAYVYDECMEINVETATARYYEFTTYILPDILEDKIQTLQNKIDVIKNHTDEYTNGLITVNELIGYLQKITK